MTWEALPGMLAIAMAAYAAGLAVARAVARLERYYSQRKAQAQDQQHARLLIQVGLTAASKYTRTVPPGSTLWLHLEELNRLLPHTAAAIGRNHLSFDEAARMLCEQCLTANPAGERSTGDDTGI